MGTERNGRPELAETVQKRQRILDYIRANDGIQASNIHRGMNLEQSETSIQLRKLREAGSVRTEQKGNKIFYYIKSE